MGLRARGVGVDIQEVHIAHLLELPAESIVFCDKKLVMYSINLFSEQLQQAPPLFPDLP